MADILQTAPFNFSELYTGLQQQFKDAGYDTAEGSNVSQLCTAMAYLTSMLNVNTAVNINETILPLATKRNNVLQDARALGYEIQHQLSYEYSVTLTFAAGDYIIPYGTAFTDSGTNKTYYYMGTELNLSGVSAGYTVTITVIEGTLYTYSSNPNTLTFVTGTMTDASGVTVPQYYIDVPYTNVEDNGIEVYVTYYDDFGNLVTREPWTKSTQFMVDADTSLNKKFVRLDNIEYGTPRVYFQISGIGAGIKEGSTVEMNVLTTSGVNGAMTSPLAPANLSTTISGATISSISLIADGTDEESIANIQTNAPLFFNSANRAVTKLDYEAICDRQTTVNESLVWGGDDEWPKCPGHIWFSFFPTRYDRTFTNNTFNTLYTLDNAGDFTWDYSLSTSDPAYTTQVTDSYTFYDARFLQDSDIRSFEVNSNGQVISPGVWDVLDNYKIPTLEYHNRHPIYMDFNYTLSIMKYNIASSTSSVNANVFNTIDDFFSGTNDSVKMETFEVDYFGSNLTKRVDTVLTDATGTTISLTNQLLLTKKNVCQENYSADYRDLYIPLAIPFETLFDTNGYLQYANLPKIDTLNFIEYYGETGKNLYTDWSLIQTDINNSVSQVNTSVIEADVRVTLTETQTLTNAQSSVVYSTLEIIPDDPTQLDSTTPTYTFDNTTVTLDRTGCKPAGIAYDTVLGYLYVANETLGTVSVIDPDTNTVYKTVTVGTSPIGVVYDSTDGYVYVVNSGSNDVSVINTSTNTVIATVTVGTLPKAAVYDSVNNYVYVANDTDGTVSVISTSTNTVSSTVTVGTNPTGLAYDSTDGYVYVTNFGDGTVSVISTSTNTVTTTITVGSGPNGAAYDSTDGYVYVANYTSGNVSVITTSTNTVTATVTVGTNPSAVLYAAGSIYVANEGDGTLSVITPSTNAVSGTITVGTTPTGLVYDATVSSIYVSNYGDGTLSIINSSTLAVTSTINAVTPIILTYSTDWSWSSTALNTVTLVSQTIYANDKLIVNSNALVGSYTLFNGYKKYITVQLYVDATGFVDTSTATYSYTSPKSYLTTTDGFYDYTIDNFYITTNGYSITSQSQINAFTGNISKTVSPSLYSTSALKMDLFLKNRWLNLSYQSSNFTIRKNVIPRLNSVTFA